MFGDNVDMLDDDNISSETETIEISLARGENQITSASKPDISDRLPAVHIIPETGEHIPLFEINDDIIIERYASSLPGNPWLDTQTYTVKGIDDATGNLRLWNPVLHQWALGNFILGPKKGDVYALIGKNPNYQAKISEGSGMGASVANQNSSVPGKRKGRGRPKGSVNRPKHIIAAEKKQREQEKQAKKAARELKKKKK